MSCAIVTSPCIHHYPHRRHDNHLNLTVWNSLTTTFTNISSYPRLRTVVKAYSSSIKTHQNSPTTYPNNNNNSRPLPNSNIRKGTSDPELRAVLELATNSELFDLEAILFGSSYFSPLLKSISNGVELDRFMIEEDFEEREQFIDVLESRFLYLAADARSTLRGWRPSYISVLLDVRKELKVPCSTKLSAEDLEVEIFIFMIQKCSRDWDTATAVRVGAAELCSVLLKGGQVIALLKIFELVSTKLSGKLLLEALKLKIDGEVVKKGFTGVASRYVGARSLASVFGPVLWGTFLADIVIQMLGTDYIRILKAIYAFAQIRILRRHGLHLDKLGTGF